MAKRAVVERGQDPRTKRERWATRQSGRRGRCHDDRLPDTERPGCSIRVGRCSCGVRTWPQRFLPRTSMRWAVHSEPPRSTVAELPCHPQVHVMVCAWCLYSSMTCLNGSFAMAGLTGGRLFNGDSCTMHAEGVRGFQILLDSAIPCSKAPRTAAYRPVPGVQSAGNNPGSVTSSTVTGFGTSLRVVR